MCIETKAGNGEGWLDCYEILLEWMVQSADWMAMGVGLAKYMVGLEGQR